MLDLILKGSENWLKFLSLRITHNPSNSMRFNIDEVVYVTSEKYLVKIIGIKDQRFVTTDGKTYSEKELLSIKESDFFINHRIFFYLYLIPTFIIQSLIENSTPPLFQKKVILSIYVTSDYWGTIHIGGLRSILWVILCFIFFYKSHLNTYSPSKIGKGGYLTKWSYYIYLGIVVGGSCVIYEWIWDILSKIFGI
jgi:hypothetical protein